MKVIKFMLFAILISVVLKGFAASSNANKAIDHYISKTESQKIYSENKTKLDINSCSIEDLQSIEEISKTKAKNIISYRKVHGKFKSLSEIKLVKGFKRLSEKNLKNLENYLYIK